MPYDPTNDRHSGLSGSRDTPATRATALTVTDLSDTTDLAIYAKTLRIHNGSSVTVTLLVTPLLASDDTATGAAPLSVPAGVVGYEAIAVRRIWSTGSTGLAAGLAAGTVEILLLTE